MRYLSMNSPVNHPLNASGSHLVSRAREIASLAREHAVAAENARVLAREVVDAIGAADLFRLAVPAVYGGPEADPVTYVDAIAALSEGDAAAGWYAAVSSTTSVLAWYLQPEAVREIYVANPASLTGGSFAPTGRGSWVDGRLRVDEGRWPWGSCGLQADWMTGGVLDGDRLFIIFLPRGDFEPHDTWHAFGLKATASNDFSVRKGAIVPGHRILEFGKGFVPAADSALARFPGFVYIAAAYAAVLLGNARGAIHELVDLARHKVPTGSEATLAETPLTQLTVAQSEARLLAASAFVRESLASIWETIQAGDPATVDQRTTARLAISHAAQEASKVVDALYTLGGATSTFLANPLQKRLRDAHVATQHLLVSEKFFLIHGQQRLGFAIDEKVIATL
jgi:alkylation response protein AidB-like acyl-CoA dehydrogenase